MSTTLCTTSSPAVEPQRRLTGGHGRLSLDSPQALDSAWFLYGLWHTHRVVDPAAAEWDSVASGVHFAAGQALLTAERDRGRA